MKVKKRKKCRICKRIFIVKDKRGVAQICSRETCKRKMHCIRVQVYYKNNKEKVDKYNQEYRVQNKETVKEYQAEYFQKIKRKFINKGKNLKNQKGGK